MEETTITTAVEERVIPEEVEGAEPRNTEPKKRRIAVVAVALGTALVLGIGVTVALTSGTTAPRDPTAADVAVVETPVGVKPAAAKGADTSGRKANDVAADKADVAQDDTAAEAVPAAGQETAVSGVSAAPAQAAQVPAAAPGAGKTSAAAAPTVNKPIQAPAGNTPVTNTPVPAPSAPATPAPAAPAASTPTVPTATPDNNQSTWTWHNEEGYWKDVPEVGHWEHREALYGLDGYYGSRCSCGLVFQGEELFTHQKANTIAGLDTCRSYITPVWQTTGEKLIEPEHDEWVVDVPAHQEWVVTQPSGWY
jgi:hypothetical protein